MYKVWEVKMPLNTNFDGKILLRKPLLIFQSIKKTPWNELLKTPFPPLLININCLGPSLKFLVNESKIVQTN